MFSPASIREFIRSLGFGRVGSNGRRYIPFRVRNAMDLPRGCTFLEMTDPSDGSPGALTLADGRALSYAEWGDPSGTPVLHFHGIPGSRLERHFDDRIYARLGIRYITSDRPGYGRSDPKDDRSFVDWASDVQELTDHLGIDRFRIFAVSGGGPFALAVASAMAGRVERVAIVSGPGPVDRPGAFRGMEFTERLNYWGAPRYPRVASALTGAFLGSAARASDLVVRAASHAGKTVAARASDARVLSDQLREALRQGARAAVWENALCARPWEFPLSDVATEVLLWHGDHDRVCPLHHAEYLASILPTATLTVRRGGHFLVLRCAEETLRALIA
jgi:pimeloyl-ACP methyl ester carboxylesterase